MKRLLLLFLLVAGCHSWDVRAFGVPVGKEPRYVVASSDDLTTEEKLGVIMIVAIAVAVPVAIALSAH